MVEFMQNSIHMSIKNPLIEKAKLPSIRGLFAV